MKRLAMMNILAFILVIVLNTLAVVLPLNGKSTGELSNQYPNLFTPAGLTFSIWSLIYLLLLGFTIYQAIILFKNRYPLSKRIAGISWPFIINCLANASWIIAWHYEQVLLSVSIMLVILISLITIHEKLQIALPSKPFAQKLWLDLPFSIYLGWISIATIANITALLVHLKWNGAGVDPRLWTVIMISTGAILNIFMVLSKNNIAFGFVGVWALTGIIIKRKVADGEHINLVIFCAQISISLIAVSIILQILKYWNRSAMPILKSDQVAESER